MVEKDEAYHPIRVLVVADRFPARSETFVLGEIEGLRRLGLEAHVFALQRGGAGPPGGCTYSRGLLGDLARVLLPRPSEITRHIRALLSIFRWHPRWVFFGLARTPTAVFAARQIQRFGLSSVHAHFFGAPAVIGVCAAAVAKVPVSLSPHANLGVFKDKVVARLLNRAAFTAACWRGAARSLSRLGPRVHYLPHGVDLGFFHQAERSGHTRRILAVARLVKKKGIDVLLDAVEILFCHTQEWHLVIVGEGPLRGELVRKARQGVAAEHIELRGAASPLEVAEALSSADLLVVPSTPEPRMGEGVPNVILEAFAAGVPVVASDTGGIPEVVRSGETGILYPPGDSHALANVLLRIIRGEEDLEPFVRSARSLVEVHYRRDRWLARLAGLHRSVGGTL
jgi:glycosyltransferase involved in cell wall biosynthesis